MAIKNVISRLVGGDAPGQADQPNETDAPAVPKLPGDELTLLGIDTASNACSVAVWRKGEVRGEVSRAMERGQAEILMPFIQESLSRAKVGVDELDGVVATVGPGSFTGIRVGLATARALGLARGIPVVGVSCLEAVAAGVTERDHQGRAILVALDSKRIDVFAQVFGPDMRALSEPACVPARHLMALAPPGPVVLAGNAQTRLLPALANAPFDCYESSAPGQPDPAVFLTLAARRWADDGNLPPEPLYLRKPEAKPMRSTES